ncbi:hypothetical protein ACUR5C_01355 [Aliikangiella sp. IMCC44653]
MKIFVGLRLFFSAHKMVKMTLTDKYGILSDLRHVTLAFKANDIVEPTVATQSLESDSQSNNY